MPTPSSLPSKSAGCHAGREFVRGLGYALWMMEIQDREALTAWLAWQVAMGAEAAVGEETIDWLARGPSVPGEGLVFEAAAVTAAEAPAVRSSPAGNAVPAGMPGVRPTTPPQRAPTPVGAASAGLVPARAPLVSPAATPSPASRQFPTAAPDAAEANARRLAGGAKTLAELQALLAGFDGCALKATAKNLCFYRGAETAAIMFIGEAPGREEDLEGRPFAGPAGQLLDKMLKAAKLAEADVHITSIVYWRPPGNRTPTLQEVQICRPFLERQIELVAPRIIVPLGAASAKAVLDIADGINKARGKWHDITIGRHTCRAMATLHPDFLLRTPSAKRQAWRDLLAITAAAKG